MSAHPGTIEACNKCDYKDTVCDSDCEIYQDLKAEYEYEVREDRRNEQGL